MERRGKVHLIGIGGCGVRGLAAYFLARGMTVSGSDRVPAQGMLHLRENGARIYLDHDAGCLPRDVDQVVISRAIPEDNSELVEARRRGLLVDTYSEALGKEMRRHVGNSIGVAGTHGKTTTSAWLALMLKVSGRDPTFLIGGDCLDFGSGMALGAGPEFIAEACEFGGSFLDLKPGIGVILNIEDDHQECYDGPDGVLSAFGKFARTIPPAGMLVLNSKFLGKVKDWGVTARVIPVWTDGKGRARKGYCLAGSPGSGEKQVLLKDGCPLMEMEAGVPGKFNLSNMLFAAAVAVEVGAPPEAVAQAARIFRGVKRRFEDMGTFHGVTVVDDYAHHPTEIQAVLTAARTRYEGRRLKAVFEPHQFRRLNNYLTDFARELSAADQVVVCDVFPARERPEDWLNIGPTDLVNAISREGGDARFLPLENAAQELAPELDPGDVVLTMGAGRVGEVADGLVRCLR